MLACGRHRRFLVTYFFLALGQPLFAQDPLPPSEQWEQNVLLYPPHSEVFGGDPVNLFTGNLQVEETDVTIEGRGLDFTFSRTYRNGTSYDSPLGRRWDFNWNQKIILQFDDDYIPPYWGPGEAVGPRRRLGPKKRGGKGPGASASIWPSRKKVPLIGAFYYDGASRIDKFTKPKKGVWTSPKGYFAKLRHFGSTQHISLDPPDYFELRQANGTIYTFSPIDPNNTLYHKGLVYALTKVQDRQGNRIHVLYEQYGEWTTIDEYAALPHRLDAIIDTFGRRIDFDYPQENTDKFDSITDFAGRTVSFERENGNLVEVRTPPITGSVSENNYPNGKTVRYEYGDQQSPSLKNNIVSVIDGQEWQNGGGSATPYLINEYNPAGTRVIRQVFGGTNYSGIAAGGTYLFLHETPSEGSNDWGWFVETDRVLQVDPNGNATLTLFDKDGYDRLSYACTGRLDPESLSPTTPVSSLISVDPSNPDPAIDGLVGAVPLRAGDPKSYITKKTFNAYGQLAELDGPGEHVEYTHYDGPDCFQKGNIIKSTRRPKPNDGSEPIQQMFVHEPFFNQIRATYSPRGLDPGYSPPNGTTTLSKADRYRSENTFDYQEDDVLTTLEGLINTWEIDIEQDILYDSSTGIVSQAGSSLSRISDSDGLQDINGDGVSTQAFGNVLIQQAPTTNVYANSADPSSNYQQQVIKTTFIYNDNSLLVSITDPEGHVNTNSFYAENDPDGDGNVVSTDPQLLEQLGLNLGTETGSGGGGFLQQTDFPEAISLQYEYDQLGRPKKFRNGRGFEWETTYNEIGQLAYTMDSEGYEEFLLYDWNNNLIERRRTNETPGFGQDGLPTGAVETSPQLEHRFEYDILNHLIKEDEPGDGGRIVTEHRYDKLGNQVLTLTPEFANDSAEVVSLIYDERNLLYTRTRGGLTSTFTALPANGDIPEASTVQSSSEMSTTSRDYDAAGNLLTLKMGRGNETTHEYDAFNRRKRTEDGEGNYTTRSWDPESQLTEQRAYDGVDTILAQLEYKHDELGRIYEQREKLSAIGVAIPTPDGLLSPEDGFVTTRHAFDKNSKTTQVVDDNLHVTAYEYDDLNRPTRITDPAGNYTTFAYDKANNPILKEDYEKDSTGTTVGPFSTWQFYDKLDRKVATAHSSNNGEALGTRFLYDSRSNLAFESDPQIDPALGLTESLANLDSHGEHGDLSGWVVNLHGNTTHYEYDDAGRLKKSSRHLRVDGLGGQPIDPTQGGGDGELTTLRTYDLNSRLKTQTDDNGNSTTHIYDPLGRTNTTFFADGTTEVWSYNKNDYVSTYVDPNGTAVIHTYDNADRVTSKTITPSPTYPIAGPFSETLLYDGLSRVTSVTFGSSTVARDYDTLGRVLQETQNGRSVTSVFDGVGNLSTLTYPDGRSFSRTYDSADRLVRIEEGATTIAEYGYVGPMRPEWRSYPINNTRMLFSYDQSRRIKGTRHEDDVTQTAFDDRSYVWDRAFNKTSRHDLLNDILHEYEYDSVYQMTTSTRTVASVVDEIDYTLDGALNRASVVGGLNAGTYALDAGDREVNQYTATPGDTRTYDDKGNLVSIVKDSAPSDAIDLTFDYRSRLSQYTDSETAETYTYQYDAFGRRTAKDVNGQVTEFVYWGWQCIEERNGASVDASYVYGRDIDEVLTMDRSAITYFYHGDDLGNIVALTNAAGDVVESYEYADYGTAIDPLTLSPISQSSVGNPYLFHGRRLDEETGYYWFRTRHMDPRIGRFLSRDVIGIWGDPASYGNGTAFSGNNPWSYRDPLGLSKTTQGIMLNSAGAIFGPIIEIFKFAVWSVLETIRFLAWLEFTAKSHEWRRLLRGRASKGDRSVIAATWKAIYGEEDADGEQPKPDKLDLGAYLAQVNEDGKKRRTARGGNVSIPWRESGYASEEEYMQAALESFVPVGRAGKLGKGLWGWLRSKFAARGGARAVDANKLHHIFDKAGRNLDDVVKAAGSREAAFGAMEKAAQGAFDAGKLAATKNPGVFEGVVNVGGADVTVRGAVVDGIFRIGSAWR